MYVSITGKQLNILKDAFECFDYYVYNYFEEDEDAENINIGLGRIYISMAEYNGGIELSENDICNALSALHLYKDVVEQEMQPYKPDDYLPDNKVNLLYNIKKLFSYLFDIVPSGKSFKVYEPKPNPRLS